MKYHQRGQQQKLMMMCSRCFKMLIPRYKQLREIIPSGTHEDRDVALLQGPPKTVHVHKKLTIEDEKTGRLITYAPKSDNSTCNHSIVQISSGVTPPVFGCITMCFTHTFSDCSSKFVLLNVYNSSQQDPDCKIWWMPVNNIAAKEQVIMKATSLSAPLYTAIDEGKLWFLNSH